MTEFNRYRTTGAGVELLFVLSGWSASRFLIRGLRGSLLVAGALVAGGCRRLSHPTASTQTASGIVRRQTPFHQPRLSRRSPRHLVDSSPSSTCSNLLNNTHQLMHERPRDGHQNDVIHEGLDREHPAVNHAELSL